MIILPLRKLAEMGKKCILTWFCEAIISYGIFNEEMKECLSLPFGSPMLFTVLWKRGKNQVAKT